MLFAAACVGAMARGVRADIDSVQQGFAQPPMNTRPMVRWWWFGPSVTQAELEREMKAMKAGGFGGFELQVTYPLAVDNQPQGVVNGKFLSKEYLDDLHFVGGKAKELGLRVQLTLGSGWPYGGPMFSIDENAGALRVAHVKVSDGATVSVPAMREGEILIGAYAGSPAAEVKVDAGSVVVPAGASDVWFIIQGHTGMKVKRPALGAEGYVIDHEDAKVAAKFIQEVAQKQIDALGENVPESIFCDSLEVYKQDWTPTLLEEFKKRRGYDLKPLLPALVTDIGPKTADIRHDWGETLTELFNDNFAKVFHELAQKEHTKFRIQAYGIPSAGLFTYLNCDLPEGEGYQWQNYRASRYASSAAHLMGVPVASSETFTWLHPPVFRATPLDIQAEANLHFLQGINQLICHGWPYSPPEVAAPGWSFYAAAVFNDSNPFYDVMPDVNDSLARASYLLRQGAPSNDIALYLANDDAWAKFTPGTISLSDGVGKQLGEHILPTILESGYNVDFFDDQMLAKLGKVKGKELTFSNSHYKAVVLAGVERIPPATVDMLEAFANGGGLVIATRRLPDKAPGYQATDADQKHVQDGVVRLFKGDDAPGLFVGKESELPEALAKRLKPDMQLVEKNPLVGFVHRHTEEGELYFVANTSGALVDTEAVFRVPEGSLRPELWDLRTGSVQGMEAAMTKATEAPLTTRVRLHLEPYSSEVVAFTQRSLPPVMHAHGDIKKLELSKGWTVQFDPAKGATELSAFGSWTEMSDMKFYSGKATYVCHVRIPEDFVAGGRRIKMEFGPSKGHETSQRGREGTGFFAALDAPVRDAAIVTVNDQKAGAVYAAPYAIDLTNFLKPGGNDIRIEVANTNVNMLAGKGFPNYDDAALNKAFGNRFTPAKASAFESLPSGLLFTPTLTSE